MPKKETKKEKYFEAVGKIKTAVARVSLFTGSKEEFLVNGKSYKEYFPTPELQGTAILPLVKMKADGKFFVSAKIKGGGISSQAEAVRHGISRALVKFSFMKP